MEHQININQQPKAKLQESNPPPFKFENGMRIRLPPHSIKVLTHLHSDEERKNIKICKMIEQKDPILYTGGEGHSSAARTARFRVLPQRTEDPETSRRSTSR